MRKLLLLLKILLGIVILLVALAIGALWLFHNAEFQNRALKLATEQLSEQLGTKVTIDSIRINVFSQEVELYGVDVEDQQQRKMLEVERLSAKPNLMALRRDELKVSKAQLKGCHVLIVRSDTDSTANYEFIIENLKRKKPKEERGERREEKPKKKLTYNINNIKVEDIALQYNDNRYCLGSLTYQRKLGRGQLAVVKDVSGRWRSNTKKGPVDKRLSIAEITFHDEDGQRRLVLDSLNYMTDNHRPRKNHHKPKHGAFDVGHLNVNLHLEADISYMDKDSIVATVEGRASDKVTGIDLRKLDMRLSATKRQIDLSDVVIQQAWTILKIDKAVMQLPSKREERGERREERGERKEERRTLAYRASNITGRVQLKDISQPFAPVLGKFTLPLYLKTNMSGDDNSLIFSNVSVKTSDKMLDIRANGTINNLKDAHQLLVRFDVNSMRALGDVKERIISQFPVKRLMTKQLHALGDITYKGHFQIPWRKEQFSGLLQTQVGNLNFYFTIDESTKYISGSAQSDDIHVGKTFDLPNIGVASCRATFKVDISKPRTARMRQLKGGKLPIGEASIQVAEVTFKKIKVRNVNLDINSDGALALGALRTHGRHMDLACDFSFTSTDEMKKMKIMHPSLKLHWLSDEDRQKKAEEKARKKQEKAERKAEKKREKELRKAEKQREKRIKKQ